MSRANNFYLKHGLYINAGLLATHVNCSNKEFRQRDLKFYIEVLANWMNLTFSKGNLEIQNTQIQRLLESLTQEGLLVKNTKPKNPSYSFRAIGLLEITNRLVNDECLEELTDFYFLFHFVNLYAFKMQSLLLEQKGLPMSYQLEIKHLLNPRNLIERQKNNIQHKIDKLQQRIDEAYLMNDMASDLLKKNIPLGDIVKKVEAKYPYELNFQKKMTELFRELTPEVQLIEISEAPRIRAQTLWEPLLKHYQAYLENIERLYDNVTK